MEILTNFIIGIVSGGITSYVITQYFKKKQDQEEKQRKEILNKEKEERSINDEYIQFKQYIHELKLYSRNILIIWDTLSLEKDSFNDQTKLSLKKLIRHLSYRPYDITKDFVYVDIDNNSNEHLENINYAFQKLCDYVIKVEEENISYNQSSISDKILNIMLAIQKINTTELKGKTVKCDFFL
ncbi:hypothetical protein [Priestia megaterium]|uniref:hypothetical protein n=1 Tax=Priestia megaterium TaxID=1404 RepID=UPI00222089DC|nr:hypothetical protein [Priestia megaterium]MDC7772228.1 hypothetical protein [Priestia megaterium]UYT83801.1 hypothetical protein OHU75_13950 [Priestia megaterium]